MTVCRKQYRLRPFSVTEMSSRFISTKTDKAITYGFSQKQRKTAYTLQARCRTQASGGRGWAGAVQSVCVWKGTLKLAMVFSPAEGRPGPTPPPSSSCPPCFFSTCGGRESTSTPGEVRDAGPWHCPGEVHRHSSGLWISPPPP